MKFLEKLKEKLIDQNFKKGAIKAAAIAVLATAVVTFAACNKTGQAPGSGTNNGGGTQQGPDTSYTASQILEENTAYKNLNLTNAVFDEIQQNVAKQFNVEKDKVEIVDMHFDKQNTSRATVVAKIGGEKVVTASYQNQKIAKLRGDKKDLVLEEAGYTADQKVEKDQKATVDAKFTQAVQTILDEIKQIKNITPERVNEIFAGISDIKLPDSLKNNYDFAVVSGVREDRTVVVFTGKNGKFEDHVLSVDGKENMTNEEILAAIKSGTGFSQTTRTIDPSKKYEAPALEQKPVVKVDFDKIFDEVFGSDYKLVAPETIMNDLCAKLYTDGKILFTGKQDGQYVVYANFTASNRNRLGKSVLKNDYEIADNLMLSEFLTNYKRFYETNANLKQTLKDNCDYTEDEMTDENVRQYLTDSKTSYENRISKVNSLTKSDFTNTSVMADTKDAVDKEAFGAKLCEGKEVIATYVGAMGTKQLDVLGRFDTGYYSAFNTTVVYKDGDQIIIKKDKIYVPYYNNSTNESLYNTFLSDTDGTKHNIESISTEIVNNPVIATEKEKKAEYNISFESKDPQLVDIASSAISQWLKNEEDSLSR